MLTTPTCSITPVSSRRRACTGRLQNRENSSIYYNERKWSKNIKYETQSDKFKKQTMLCLRIFTDWQKGKL